ncbi:hypothetical protein D1871_05780 [Nakamurella silvestris]|nr:hypothetical protein D1871_05780 [Nakamurella silvestris]
MQAGIGWSRKAWGRLETHQDLLNRLGSRITREEVTAYARQIVDPPSALAAFIVAMVWGHGRSGYGPFRTARVINENGGQEVLGAELLSIAQTCFTQGGLVAFGEIAARRKQDKGYLKHLGPAFGTKYLYFCTKAAATSGVPIAPILDAVVARWFEDQIPGSQLRIWWWDVESYQQYVDQITSWAQILGVEIDIIEQLIFATSDPDERSGAGTGQWDRIVPPAPDAAHALAELIRALRDTGDPGLLERTAEPLAALDRMINAATAVN